MSGEGARGGPARRGDDADGTAGRSQPAALRRDPLGLVTAGTAVAAGVALGVHVASSGRWWWLLAPVAAVAAWAGAWGAADSARLRRRDRGPVPPAARVDVHDHDGVPVVVVDTAAVRPGCQAREVCRENTTGCDCPVPAEGAGGG